MAGQCQGTRRSFLVDPSTPLGPKMPPPPSSTTDSEPLSGCPTGQPGLRLEPCVWSRLSPRGSKHFYKHPQLHPPQLLSCLLSVFYYYILLGVVFNPQAPSKGNSPTPVVEEARTQAPPASQPASSWDSRQGKVPHHNCAQPRFSHSRLQAGTAQAEKVSLGSRPCGG